MNVATLLVAALAAAVPQTPAASPAPTPAPNQNYDDALAKRLGADARGMKMYVLVLLKTGPKPDLPKEENERAFAGHFANITRLAEL